MKVVTNGATETTGTTKTKGKLEYFNATMGKTYFHCVLLG